MENKDLQSLDDATSRSKDIIDNWNNNININEFNVNKASSKPVIITNDIDPIATEQHFLDSVRSPSIVRFSLDIDDNNKPIHLPLPNTDSASIDNRNSPPLTAAVSSRFYSTAASLRSSYSSSRSSSMLQSELSRIPDTPLTPLLSGDIESFAGSSDGYFAGVEIPIASLDSPISKPIIGFSTTQDPDLNEEALPSLQHNNNNNNINNSLNKNSNTRPRSKTQSHFNNYRKKLNRVFNDDYYTKAIIYNTETDISDDDHEETNGARKNDHNSSNTNLASQSLLLNYEKEEAMTIFSAMDENVKLTRRYSTVDDNILNSDNTTVEYSGNKHDPHDAIGRLEWQAMLESVLHGDVLKSEKTKLKIVQQTFTQTEYSANLWIFIKAKLSNKSFEQQQKEIELSRILINDTIKEILNFKVNHNNNCLISAEDQINDILEKWSKCNGLYPTISALEKDKPECSTQKFRNKIDALVSWVSITLSIRRKIKSLNDWTGSSFEVSEETNNGDSDDNCINEEEVIVAFIRKPTSQSEIQIFASQILKQKEVIEIFEKSIFQQMDILVLKTKQELIDYGDIFKELELPSFMDSLVTLLLFPTKLIQEIITIRLNYAKKVSSPTMMMIDQMIGDLSSYMKIALKIKKRVIEFCSDKWNMSDYIDESFDAVILDCIEFYIKLLQRKLFDTIPFKTLKEPNQLEHEWLELKRMVGFINGCDYLIAIEFSSMISKMVSKLLVYLKNQLNGPPIKSTIELTRWYSRTNENLGILQRKLLRFSNSFAKNLYNASEYSIEKQNALEFVKRLKSTEHYLIHCDSFMNEGLYIFAHPEILADETLVSSILNSSGLKRHIDSNPIVNLDHDEDDVNEDYYHSQTSDHFLPYLIIVCPEVPVVWDGPIISMQLNEAKVPDDLNPGTFKLILRGCVKDVEATKTIFDQTFKGTINCLFEYRSNIPKVNRELIRTARLFSKLSLLLLDMTLVIKEQSFGFHCQDLVNNMFAFARDFGKNLLKHTTVSTRRKQIIRKLINLSIEWVSFVCDDCEPNDPKTFRWTVASLELTMEMTKDLNILAISDEQFKILRLKVARSMTLLISHFDVMGARSREAEKRRIQSLSTEKTPEAIADYDDEVTEKLRNEIVKKIDILEDERSQLQHSKKTIGRVLDDTKKENKIIGLLASSFAKFSIRWQQGQFIGAGTFGSVYTAVNLDTGTVVAVKEIRLNDSHSIKRISASVKQEVSALGVLNHPNIVQYYGVEVHRDKVFLFMEYCQGGSLSMLLEYGRMEDETMIQVYVLQLLEGLSYLHKSGIVHRDVKPENILLDHNGVVKFVDFGAAKFIKTSGSGDSVINATDTDLDVSNDSKALKAAGMGNSLTGTPMYMSPEVITGSGNSASGRFAIDIWSLGCVIIELASGRRPWSNLDNEWAIMYHIAAGHLPKFPSPDQLTQAGLDFLSRCFEIDPTKRATADELLEDPWMVDISFEVFGDNVSSSDQTNSL